MKNLFKGIPLLVLFTGACGMELRKNEVNTIALERVHARVLRYDCQKELISDKTEEVQSPEKWLRINAESRKHKLDEANIQNLSHNPENNSGMISYHTNGVSFLVHYSNTWLGYQVVEGLNEFSYKFFEQASSGKLNEFESGRVLVEVSYSERFDPKVYHYHKSDEECAEEEEAGKEHP
jgi:hypothetical protein